MASVINQIKFNDIEYAIAASAYAECSTAAGTAAKVATICTDGDTTNTGFALVKGVSVKVKFTVTNTASSPTLNINGTGAKAIMYRGSAINKGYLAANRIYEFVYDGTDWELVGDIDTNTDTNTNTAHTHTNGVGLVRTGDGGTSGTVDYKAKLRSETALTVDSSAASTTSGRVYPVAVDKSGYLAVNVPWTDTNTQDGNDNQKVKVGSVTFGANDVVEFVAGSNVSISGNATNKQITISATDNNTDTKNTTGATNKVNTKLFLAGATSQTENPQTYSNIGCYIGTDNALYSNGKKVALEENIPTIPDLTVSQATSSGVNATHGGTVNVVTNVTKGDANHEIDVTMTPIIFPSETTLSKGVDTTGTATTLTHGGKFKAVTDTTVNGHAITDVVTEFTLPSETKLSKANDSTGTKTLSYGDTFTAVTDTTVNGHQITDTTITYTLPGVPTVSGTASYTLGGISKGTTYTNESIIEVLKDLLFPYIAPSINSFKLLKSSSTQNTIAEAEYGENITISYITLTFNGSNSITSIKIGTTSGGSNLLNSSSATSGTAITLTTAWTPATNADATIYCSISDGTNTATKSTTLQRKYYNYSTVSSNATPPTTGLTKRTATGGEATYTYSAGDYVWLYDRSNSKRIQQFAAGEWFDVAMTGPTPVTITLSNGTTTAAYYAYGTSKMASGGSATYKLI